MATHTSKTASGIDPWDAARLFILFGSIIFGIIFSDVRMHIASSPRK
nr:hypothetical protein [Candidatus Sigynarchaeota archaeon]